MSKNPKKVFLFAGRAFAASPAAVAAVALIAALLLLQAIVIPRFDEDAFIYLRYAQNLADGHGLVYNPGERYESNTAFLWSVLLSLVFVFEIDPYLGTQTLGWLVWGGVLILTYFVVARLDGPKIALLALFLLGTHATFFVFAKTGFAPHLQSFFALLSLLLTLRFRQKPAALGALAVGICLVVLMMTRLDSAVFFAPLWALAAFVAWRSDGPRFFYFALACVLPGVLFGVFLFCKFLYYGDILPATYYAKAGPNIPEFYDFVGRGVFYIYLYLREYWLLWLLPALAYGGWLRLAARYGRRAKKGARKRKNRTNNEIPRYWSPAESDLATLTCAAMTALWLLYILRIGGGYIEFRFFVPVSPFLFILIARALAGLDWRATIASAAFLTTASLYHHFNYESSGRPGISSPRKVAFPFPGAPGVKERLANDDHGGYGLALRDLLADDLGEYSEDAKIAVTSGGLLAFLSRVAVLEMHGWADSRVFEPGNYVIVQSHDSGHQRQASPDFMKETGVNLVFGHILAVDAKDDVLQSWGAERLISYLTFTGADVGKYSWPQDMQIVEIPIKEGRKKMIALYLTRNSRLDDLFRRRGIVARDVSI